MTQDKKKKTFPRAGKQPRSRNLSGRWRKKRSDTGKPRKQPFRPKKR